MVTDARDTEAYAFDRELLQKLGEAVYLHKKLAEDAQKASEAVDYLVKQGALNHV